MQDLDRLARMYTPRMRQKVAAAGSPLIDEGLQLLRPGLHFILEWG
jgi:hypothetical protein